MAGASRGPTQASVHHQIKRAQLQVYDISVSKYVWGDFLMQVDFFHHFICPVCINCAFNSCNITFFSKPCINHFHSPKFCWEELRAVQWRSECAEWALNDGVFLCGINFFILQCLFPPLIIDFWYFFPLSVSLMCVYNVRICGKPE